MTLLSRAARVLLGALFLWASASKVPDMAGFAESVANYRIVPPALVPFTASALVGLEMAAGVALMVNVWARAAALLLGALLAAFTVGLASALARGIDLACGCFGGTDAATWWTVLRDLVLLGWALGVAASSPSPPPSPSPPLDPARAP
jgi:putative oxidoreductase